MFFFLSAKSSFQALCIPKTFQLGEEENFNLRILLRHLGKEERNIMFFSLNIRVYEVNKHRGENKRKHYCEDVIA